MLCIFTTIEKKKKESLLLDHGSPGGVTQRVPSLIHKSTDVGFGRGESLKATQTQAKAHLGPWGQGAVPPSEAPRLVKNLLLGVPGLFLGFACCPGCCTLYFWKEKRRSGGWQPSSCLLPSPLPLLVLRPYPHPQSWPDQLAWFQAPRRMPHPDSLTLLFFILSSYFSPSIHNIACKQYELDSSASNPTAGL